MNTTVTVLAVVLLVALGALVWLLFDRGTFTRMASSREVQRRSLAMRLHDDVVPQLVGATRGSILPGDVLAMVNPMDPSQALVFGDTRPVSTYGDVIGPIPGQLAAMAVGTSALVQAGIGVGQQSGMLVRLTGDSTRLFSQLQKSVDGSGAVMGVLRGAGGQFQHVIRFRPAVGLQALSGVTGALAAIAMQAQLAAIERAIAALAEDIQRVQVTLDIQASSRLAGTTEILEDIYRGAQATGIFTSAAWDQVAPLAAPVFTNRDYSERRLRALLDELAAKKSTGDRRKWLEENQNRLITDMFELEQAEQAVIQFTGLRLWWLTTTGDPSLEHYVSDMKSRVEFRQQRRDAISTSVFAGLERAGRTDWFDWVHSPFDARAVRNVVLDLVTSLRQEGLLTESDVKSLAGVDMIEIKGPEASGDHPVDT